MLNPKVRPPNFQSFKLFQSIFFDKKGTMLEINLNKEKSKQHPNVGS